MRLRHLCALAVLLVSAPPLAAQTDARLVSALRQAQAGDVDSARAAIGRLLATTPAADTLYPQLLYVSALIAPTAQEMERSLQRITVEHALTPWADDALLKLAQLDYAAGNLPGAARSLERLRGDFPDSPVFATAAVWAARSYFDMRTDRLACQWLGLGLARVRMSEPDVRDQLRFFAQRCPPAQLAQDSAAAAPVTAVPVAAADPAPADTVRPADSAPPVPRDTIRLAARDTAPIVARDTASIVARDTAPAARIDSTAPTVRADSTVRTTPPVRTVPTHRIQVIAAPTQAMADEALRRVRAMGFEGRIVPEGGLFKVRGGSFATLAQARAALPRFRAEFPGAFPVLDR